MWCGASRQQPALSLPLCLAASLSPFVEWHAYAFLCLSVCLSVAHSLTRALHTCMIDLLPNPPTSASSLHDILIRDKFASHSTYPRYHTAYEFQ